MHCICLSMRFEWSETRKLQCMHFYRWNRLNEFHFDLHLVSHLLRMKNIWKNAVNVLWPYLLSEKCQRSNHRAQTDFLISVYSRSSQANLFKNWRSLNEMWSDEWRREFATRVSGHWTTQRQYQFTNMENVFQMANLEYNGWARATWQVWKYSDFG